MTVGWEAWVRRRNAWLASPAFHRLAWAFPPLRLIARRRARALFGLVAGFTFSQLIAAAVELDLLLLLQAGPLKPDEAASQCGLAQGAMADLLEGLAAIEITQRLAGGRYALGIHGAAFLADPGLAAMVRHNRLFYGDLADPLALLRQRGGGQVAAFWPYAGAGAGEAGAYSRLMAASQPAVARAILASGALNGVTRLMDVGGGEGAFLEAVHQRHPHLQLMLFDLPAVADRASRRIGGFAEVHAGALPGDPLPMGADCISLVRVVHDHDDDVARALFARVHQALPPGGRVLVAEPMTGASMLGDVYFRLYMRAMGRGRPRSAGEIMALLAEAGFAHCRVHNMPNPYATQLVSARRDSRIVNLI